MKHMHYTEIELETPKKRNQRYKSTLAYIKKDGAENFAMRVFEVKSGGYTPLHQHDWEHEVFILEGEGEARNKEVKNLSKKAIFLCQTHGMAPVCKHRKNTLKFICLIPIKIKKSFSDKMKFFAKNKRKLQKMIFPNILKL